MRNVVCMILYGYTMKNCNVDVVFIEKHCIIQILTGMVMKYHVSVDCQENYIFPEVRSAEGKYCPEGKYNYLNWHHRHVIFQPSRSISVILDGQNE